MLRRKAATGILLALLLESLPSCIRTHELTAEEKSLLLTELDFAEFGLEVDGDVKGKYTKESIVFDRSVDYEYEFEAPDGTFYLASSVVVETSAAGARATQAVQRAAIFVGFKAYEMSETEIPLSKGSGSHASLTLLRMGGRPVGNVYSAVFGKKAAMVVFSGLYFPTQDDFTDLIGERLAAIERFGSPRTPPAAAEP